MIGAEKLAQERLKQSKDDPRALFALTLVTGLRADDAALIAKKKFSALSYTKSANGYAERLLARSPDYYDAYIATGMGKYIIGGKAAPVRWMLRLGGLKGDQEQGVKELTLVADHGRFLMPFARILLAFDDLRHNNTARPAKSWSGSANTSPITRSFCRKLPNWTIHPPAPARTNRQFSFTIETSQIEQPARTLLPERCICRCICGDIPFRTSAKPMRPASIPIR